MPITQLRIATPLGLDLLVSGDGRALCEAAFVAASRKPAQAAASDSLLREAAAQVRAYFARRLTHFDLPLALEGTPFCVEVWRAVAALGFAEFVSYADVARAVGRPLAHRGVAMAMGRTPIDLFVPAHRVVGADGRVKGADRGSVRLRLVRFERGGSLQERGKQPRKNAHA